MGLDDAIKRAICRVDVYDGQERVSHGAGFLVAADRVLTAAHVVARKNGTKRGSAIYVTFGTMVAWPQGVIAWAAATIATHPAGPETGKELLDIDGGWAVLSCVAPPGVKPLELERLRDGKGDPIWSSIGYTKTAGDPGLPYDGTVKDRDRDRLFILACTQAAGPGTDARGLSGGPCVVHGRVIGILQSAQMEEAGDGSATTVEGRLYATPIENIAEACPAVVEVPALPAIPYEHHLISALGSDKEVAKAIAKSLLHPRADTTHVDELRRFIVRKMFEGGLKTTVDVAYDFFTDLEARVDRLIELAETFWVDERAVAQLRALPERPAGARVAAINASEEETGDHYLRRAGNLASQIPEGWVKRKIPIDNTTGEQQLPELEKAIRTWFERMLEIRDDGEIRDFLQRNSPFLLVLPETAPRPAVLESLEKTFEGIHIVLLTGPIWTSREPLIDYISPELGPGQEDRALLLCKNEKKRISMRKKMGQ